MIQRWVVLLLPPVTWATAFGVLLTMSDDSCARGGRTGQLLVLAAAIALSGASGAVAVWRRTHFLMRVALGMSAIFTAVLVLMVVPTLMLGACRT